MRQDDEPLLRMVHSTLGFGACRPSGSGNSTRIEGCNPMVVWICESKAACQALRAVLGQYPLRSKKQADYSVWCDALDLWLQHQRGDSWDEFKALAAELRALRPYRAVMLYP